MVSGFLNKEYFCDREEELSTLINHIENQRNIVIYGNRRMGKTALIKCLFESLKNEKMECFLVDIMACQNLNSVIQLIGKAVINKYGKNKLGEGFTKEFTKLLSQLKVTIGIDPLTNAPEISMGIQNIDDAETTLHEIGKYLTSKSEQIVFCIDEFQQITTFSENNTEAIFRNWIQSFPTIRFIFSGSHKSMIESMFTQKNRPFYQSCNLLFLNPIPESIYQTFIQYHFKKEDTLISPEDIHTIYQWAEGQTYSVQLQCNLLYSKNLEITESSLAEVQQDILDQDKPYFGYLYNMLTLQQQKVLKAIASNVENLPLLSSRFIQIHNLGSMSSVQGAIKSLLDKDLIELTSENHVLTDVIFKNWLKSIP
jgi:hypothetical protein